MTAHEATIARTRDETGDCGILPRIAQSPDQAREMLEHDGACVLRWPRMAREEVAAAAHAILGSRVRVLWEPRTIKPNPVPDQPKRAARAKKLILESTTIEEGQLVGKPQPIHSEGWGLGAARPDFVVFQSAQEPEEGGRSYLLDGHRLIAALAASPNGRALLRFLYDPNGTGRDEPAISGAALVGRTRHGRLAVAFELPPWPIEDGNDRARAEQLERWHEHVRYEAAQARRIPLRPGDVLIMDSYRALLGRDAYHGQRAYFRSWVWSDAVFSWPLVTEMPTHQPPARAHAK